MPSERIARPRTCPDPVSSLHLADLACLVMEACLRQSLCYAKSSDDDTRYVQLCINAWGEATCYMSEFQNIYGCHRLSLKDIPRASG